MNAPRLPLGELLVLRGLISQDQLAIALTEQKRSGAKLGEMLIRLGFITEAAMREALSEKIGTRTVDLSRLVVDRAALAYVPREQAKRHSLFPLVWDEATGQLTLAMANPNNIVALDQIRLQAGNRLRHIVPVLASESDINRAIDQYYGYELSIDGILREIETGEVDAASLALGQGEYSQPVVRLIDALLADAVQREASDLHFEPEESFIRIRYRIDGVLRQIRSLHKTYWPAMVVRLKVMSGMNIAETRAPQDGRISLFLSGRTIDFRVAAQPTVHGENLVLRVLDRLKGIVPLDQLDLPPGQLDQLRLMMARPEGIILVTGPTGSGKTTTLYSVLNHLNSESVNIMTLEDPVEYPMAMVRQSSVSDTVKFDFASGIRSLMRQDPDVILVGEIRDHDTAEMAFRAAMTGHQVYSTLHTSSALGAIPRLLDIGVLPDIMAGNIVGVIGQRLLRKLCQHCREPYAAEEYEARVLGLEAAGACLYRARGCPACHYSGYRGRLAVMEILRMTAGLDELVGRRATLQELKRHALAHGFRTLADDACAKVAAGRTTLEEVARVIDLTDRI